MFLYQSCLNAINIFTGLQVIRKIQLLFNIPPWGGKAGLRRKKEAVRVSLREVLQERESWVRGKMYEL